MHPILTDLNNFHNAILQWYTLHGRMLPWRDALHHKTYELWHKSQKEHIPQSTNKHFQDSNNKQSFHHERAYRVWISEIMLQQTQVARVLQNYYFQFLAIFPDLNTLACATEHEVIKSWQGLGYYTRARNLHKTAQYCKIHYNAKLPANMQALKKLPGIGNYTAGAIACFGFGQNVSLADSNISRLLSRLFAKQNPTEKTITELAQTILNPQTSFLHNQALIDLGAMICTPKNAKCDVCPLTSFCIGKTQYENYGKSKKIFYEQKTMHLLLLIKDNKIAHIKHQGKRFKNLYGIPEFMGTKEQLLTFGIFLGNFEHTFTKYHLDINVFFYKIKQNNEIPPNLTAPLDNTILKKEEIFFVDEQDMKNLAYANLTKKALQLFLQKYTYCSKD